MLAVICRTILVTQSLACGMPMQEDDAVKQQQSATPIVVRNRMLELDATKVISGLSGPFVVSETDVGWHDAIQSSKEYERQTDELARRFAGAGTTFEPRPNGTVAVTNWPKPKWSGDSLLRDLNAEQQAVRDAERP